MSDGVRCMWMRGGTSKGGFFLASDLPDDTDARDRLLMAIMGTPDPRQIDGMGGGDPLSSKVAIVRRSARTDADVDYLFLQLGVEKPMVTDAQNCGNMLAGVGPFALERDLIPAADGRTTIRVYMENTGQTASLQMTTPGGRVTYAGTARIDGVPGTHAPVEITFNDTQGATCGALLPTGNVTDDIDSVRATLIDNGMPVVVLAARDLGIDGGEDPEVLEAMSALRKRLESIRLKAGPMMSLGDVSAKSVPKMVLVSPPAANGAIRTRTFIPHRCHKAIGVLGAVSVAAASALAGSVAADFARIPDGDPKRISIEHPSGEMTVLAHLDQGGLASCAVLRTARKLMDGHVFPREVIA